MKSCVSALVFLVALSINPGLYSQEAPASERIQRAIALLRADSLDGAWEQLNRLESSQAILLKSRILLKRGNFNEAYERILPLMGDPLPALREEASYTLAVIQFWRRHFGQVLSLTHTLKSSSRTMGLRRESSDLYDQTLSWVSATQAAQLLQSDIPGEVKRDLIHAQVRKMDWAEAVVWYQENQQHMPAGEETLRGDIEEVLASTSRHDAYRRTFVNRPTEGVIYTVGVILPDDARNREYFAINRNLYTGIQIAVDQYNEQTKNRKIRLTAFRLKENLSNVADLMPWATGETIDAFIGPLTSDQVRASSRALADYGAPLFAPLANDPTLTRSSDNLYQVNPGVEQRAKAFAEFAYNTMRYRSVALVHDGTEISRMETDSFKNRFLTLGGTVEYEFDPINLRYASRFDQQARVLTGNPYLADSLKARQVDALFLAVASSESESLFNLVLTAFDAIGSRVSILGTQDLNIIDIPARAKRDYNIFTYSPYNEDPIGPQVVDFDVQYRGYTQISPDLYGYLGFDITRYIARLSDKIPNPSTWNVSVARQPQHRGLLVPFDFDESRVNGGIYFYKLADPDKIQIGN